MSARIWQGWYSLVRPLITGTRECAAKRSMISCSKVRIITMSHHARDHLRRVLDRLAAAELRVARVEVDRRAAELVHAGLERQRACACWLLEDHRQRAVRQRPVGLVALELLLDPARALEQVLEFLAREVVELQEVLWRGRRRRAVPQAARKSRIKRDSRRPAFARLGVREDQRRQQADHRCRR